MLQFNPDDLSTQSFFDFEAGDYKKPTLGATHVVNDLSTDDTIGLLTEMVMGMPPKYLMTFYRINASNVKNRIRIGSINAKGMDYYHSFGHTKDYLVAPQNSMGFNAFHMMEGDSVQDCFVINWKNNLVINVMKIADGSNKAYQADHPGIIMHTGNTYVEGDIMTIDCEMSAKNLDPFGVFSMRWLKDNNRKGIPMGYVFRRYKINLKTEEITFHDILAPEFNSNGFPIINPTIQGKKHCYTYITEMFFQINKTAVLKIDHCNGNAITRWEEQGVYVSEPYFIDNPESEVEDDGLIVVSVFDEKIGLNRFLMIDAHTMKPVSDTKLPIRLPMTLHAQFFPKASAGLSQAPVFI